MHAANGSLAHAQSHIRLNRNEGDPLLGKFPHAPGAHESPSFVLAGSWLNYSCSQYTCRTKLHPGPSSMGFAADRVIVITLKAGVDKICIRSLPGHTEN